MDWLSPPSRWIWAPIAGLVGLCSWIAQRTIHRLDDHERRIEAIETSRGATAEDVQRLGCQLIARIDASQTEITQRIDRIMIHCSHCHDE